MPALESKREVKVVVLGSVLLWGRGVLVSMASLGEKGE
jgi:hypothetical protein